MARWLNPALLEKKKDKRVKEKAKYEILAEGQPLHQEACAKRWGVSTGTASKWLKEWLQQSAMKTGAISTPGISKLRGSMAFAENDGGAQPACLGARLCLHA